MLKGNKREEKEGKAGSSLNILDTLSGPVHGALALDPRSLPGAPPGSSLGSLAPSLAAVWPRGLGGRRRRGAFPGPPAFPRGHPESLVPRLQAALLR